jgi:hypothetical protein
MQVLTASQLASYDHFKHAMLRSKWFEETPSTHVMYVHRPFVQCAFVSVMCVIERAA